MDTQKDDEPFDRLTMLCAIMTNALDNTLQIEGPNNLQGSPVKAIVFLEDDEKAGIVMHGYPDAMDAMVSLFVHMKAIFQANGKNLEFIGIPDTPEGMDQ